MFDLEPSIAVWRKQMLTAGIKTPVPLEELESHLREEIELQMKSGSSVEMAFDIAVRRTGQPNMLKSEFNKVEGKFMKNTMIILLGIFGVLFGPAIFLPALALYKYQALWNSSVIVPMVIGAAITLLGLATTLIGFKKCKA